MSASKYPYPFPIVPRTRVWYALSLVVVLLGVGKMGHNYATREGKWLDFGIDFSGGSAYTYKFAKMPDTNAAGTIAKIRGTLEGVGIRRAHIQVFAVGNQVQVRTETGSEKTLAGSAMRRVDEEAATMTKALSEKHGSVELIQKESVGPVVGEYLRQQAILAIILGCVLILFYIWIRYNIGSMGGGSLFGICAVAALIHDVLVMLTGYAWTSKDIDTTFIASVLTVIGYSMQDTVIIYDRIRENLRKLDPTQRRDNSVVALVVEDSLWQTMTRSVMTAVCVLLPLTTLFLFGGVSVRNFAFAMMVGITTGAYSSIFFAPTLLLLLNKRASAKSAAEPVAGRTAAARPRPTIAPTAGRPTAQLAPSAARQTPQLAPKAGAPKPAPTSTAPAETPVAEADEAQGKATAKKKPGGKGKRRY